MTRATNGPAREAAIVEHSRRSGLTLAIQAVGFLVCLALLWWCAAEVFKPENREQLQRLREAPAWRVGALLGLALVSLAINGAVFQLALRPVQRLRTRDIQATNAVAALLALVPFKLSMLFRVLVHNRRDRVPLLTIAAWFGAVAAVMAASVLPPLGASLWRGRIDSAWWATSLGGIALLTAATIVGAKLFSEGAGWAWLERLVRALPLPGAIKGTPDGSRAGVLPRVHEGLRMLAHPWSVGACVSLRVLEIAVNTGRFLVAAAILDVPLPTDKAVIAATAYFLIGAAAPTGQLGAREAGTAGLLGQLMHGVDLGQFKLAVLLVTATDAAVVLAAAGVGAAWLKPWRIARAARRA